MLRAGVSFPALMKLLGHASPEMTMNYAELTPDDVYREFHALRSPSRHRPPPPKASIASLLADLSQQPSSHPVRPACPRDVSPHPYRNRLRFRCSRSHAKSPHQDCRRTPQTHHPIGAGRDWPDKRRRVCVRASRRSDGEKRSALRPGLATNERRPISPQAMPVCGPCRIFSLSVARFFMNCGRNLQ